MSQHWCEEDRTASSSKMTVQSSWRRLQARRLWDAASVRCWSGPGQKPTFSCCAALHQLSCGEREGRRLCPAAVRASTSARASMRVAQTPRPRFVCVCAALRCVCALPRAGGGARGAHRPTHATAVRCTYARARAPRVISVPGCLRTSLARVAAPLDRPSQKVHPFPLLNPFLKHAPLSLARSRAFLLRCCPSSARSFGFQQSVCVISRGRTPQTK